MPTSLLRNQGPLTATLDEEALSAQELARNEHERSTSTSLGLGIGSAAAGMAAGVRADQALEAELAGKAQEASALRQAALERAAFGQQIAPRVNTLDDIHSVGDAGSYAAGALGKALPTMAPSIAAGLLTRGRGRLRGLSYPGALVPAYAQERNEAILSQTADPVAMQRSAQERLDTARVKGAAAGALEAIVPAGLAGGLGRAGVRNTIGKAAIEEGATEAAQTRIGQLAQSHLNPTRDTSGDMSEILESTVQGAIGGGGIAAPFAGSQMLADHLQKTGVAAQAGVQKVKEAAPSVQAQMDELFHVPEAVDLDMIKKGANDVALRGKDLMETLQNVQKRNELIEQAKTRVGDNIRKYAPEIGAKLDPRNPDSLLAAAKDFDWKKRLDQFNEQAQKLDGKVREKLKFNLEEMDPGMQGDLQKLLFDNLSPNVRDVDTVRNALPTMAKRLAAMAARNGDLDKDDIDAMTDVTDSMRSLFADPKKVAGELRKYVKNSDKSFLDKILDIENARTDAAQQGSFLELSLSPKARQSGWDLKQIAKYVDKAVTDPDGANYAILRNLFGSTSKANQVLDYYAEKSGVELPQEDVEGDVKQQAFMSQVDLGDEGPQYLFADPRTMRPFSATARAKVGRGKSQYQTDAARKRLADTLNTARKQGQDMEGARAHVIGYGEYAAEQGSDMMERVAHFIKAAEKRRSDAIKKGKKLKAEGATEEQLEKERKKVMDANRELKYLKNAGENPQQTLDHLFKVVKLTRGKGPQQTGDAMGNRGLGANRLVDDNDVHSMGEVLRQEPRDPKAREARDATRITFRTPEGKPVTLSAESIARTMMPRLENVKESFEQKYQRAFAEGVQALMTQRGWVPQGNIDEALVHRSGNVKAKGGLLDPIQNKEKFPVTDSKLRNADNVRKWKQHFAKQPVKMFDKAIELIGEVNHDIKTEEGKKRPFVPRIRGLQSELNSFKEMADSAARKIYPMPEMMETAGIAKDETGNNGKLRLEELAADHLDNLHELLQNLVELAGESDAIDNYIAQVEDAIEDARSRPNKQFEYDPFEEGGRGTAGLGNRETVKRGHKERFAAQKKSGPEALAKARRPGIGPKEDPSKPAPKPFVDTKAKLPDTRVEQKPGKPGSVPDVYKDIDPKLADTPSLKLGPSAPNIKTKFNAQAADIHKALGRSGFPATHDSPHKFDGNFDWRSHAFKGEGAMAYGAGTYLSTADGVHRHYKDKFTAQIGGTDGEEIASIQSNLESETRKRDKLLQQAKTVPGKNEDKFVGRVWTYDDQGMSFMPWFYKDEVFASKAEAQRASAEAIDKVRSQLEQKIDKDDFSGRKEEVWPLQELLDVANMNIENLEQDLEEIMNESEGMGRSPTYQVSVEAEPGEILDWDASFDEQHPEVQEKLREIADVSPVEGTDVELGGPNTKDFYVGAQLVARTVAYNQKFALVSSTGKVLSRTEDGAGLQDAVTQFWDEFTAGKHDAYLQTEANPSGEKIYRALQAKLGSQEKASDFLQAAGIVGHKFAASGGSNDTHPNYVIYDDSKIITNAVSFNSQTGSAHATLDDTQRENLVKEIERARGKDIKVLFEDFMKIGGSGSYTYDPATGERIIRIALQASSPLSVARHEALHDFFTLLGGDKATQKMKDELLQVANSFPVLNQLRQLLAEHPEALKQIESDPEERLAYMYQFALNGQLRIGPKPGSIFARIYEFLKKVLHTVSTDDRAAMYLGSLNAGHFSDPKHVGTIAQAIQAQHKSYADRMEAVSELFGKIGEKVMSSATERLRDTKIGALRDVADAFHVDPDAEQPKMLPFLQRRQMARGVWQSKFFKVLEQYKSDELAASLTRLQSEQPDMSNPIDKQVRDLLDEMFDYLKTAGVKNIVREGNDNVEKELGKPENYFPRVWDIERIRQNPQPLIDAIVQHGGKTKQEAQVIVAEMTDGDRRVSVDAFDVNHVPWDQAVLARKLDFINAQNAQHFAPFQEQNMGEILHTYVEQAIHRGEYARQFGNQGQWIQEKLDEAKTQGATPEDMKTAVAAVKGMEGTLGAEISPRVRQWMTGIITAENLVLLPLALFSQVVDAMAIGARSNSFNESVKALDAGFRAVAKSFTKNANSFSDDERLAMDLGIIDETAMLEAMGMTYQGMYMSKRLRNINRKFFRINRMEQWNRAMRVSGMMAAQRFILANRENARYMSELGLKKEDVVELSSGHMAVTEADGLSASQARKIRTALFKFVDTAVLRPNAAHRPIWASDPRYMLLAHLKQFAFSFQNVILKNMKKELQYGNAKPLLVLLSSIPLIMVSDMMKAAMTGNLNQNVTFADALARGVARSGLLGTRAFYTDAYSDMTHGSLPGVSFLGPTFEHALTVAKGLLGTDGTDAVDVAVRSVPGGAAIRGLAN